MSLCDLAPQYIRDIAPYQPGKPLSELERELGISQAVKLASNENPLGYSPKAAAAMQQALPDIARYPDGNGFALKAEISRRHGVSTAQVVLGNGSNDLLELAARAFLGAGTSAVYSQYAFAVYPLAVQAVGATGIEVPAREYGHDLEAMLAAIRPDTRLVFVANPNNPTGTLLREAELLHFLERVPAEVLVVLDEAYTEYLPPEVRMNSISWLARFPNLLISRTMSKAYGLAGLRVGFALGSEAVVDLVNRVRQPFNVSVLAQAAAIAALQDEEFLRQSYDVNRAGLQQLYDGLGRLGLHYIPSYGNFVLIHVGNGQEVYQQLLRQGVIVRPVGSYALPEWLRVSVGLETENARFLDALGNALAR